MSRTVWNRVCSTSICIFVIGVLSDVKDHVFVVFAQRFRRVVGCSSNGKIRALEISKLIKSLGFFPGENDLRVM